MIRVVVFLVLAAAFVNYVAIWLADLPGTVPVTWIGYDAEVPIGILIAAVACAAVLVWELALWLLRAPRRIAVPLGDSGRSCAASWRSALAMLARPAASRPEPAGSCLKSLCC